MKGPSDLEKTATPVVEQDTQDTTVTIENVSTTRRKFSRSALTGSAVLLTLGSGLARAQDITCVSQSIVDSFSPTASHSEHHLADLADYREHVELPGTMPGGDPDTGYKVVEMGEDYCVGPDT